MKTKLIQTDKGFVVVDEDAEIKIGDYAISMRQEEIHLIQINSDVANMCCHKIAYSTYRISDTIPILTNTVEEIDQMFEDKRVIDIMFKYCEYKAYADEVSFIDGYKSNNAEFTREQMAIALLSMFHRGKDGIIDYEETITHIIDAFKPKHSPCYCEVEKRIPFTATPSKITKYKPSYTITKLI